MDIVWVYVGIYDLVESALEAVIKNSIFFIDRGKIIIAVSVSMW